MQILLNQQHKIILRIFLNHPILTEKKKKFSISKHYFGYKGAYVPVKDLHNIPYVNKMFFFKFGNVISPRCSFCKLHETIMHLFYDCLIAK